MAHTKAPKGERKPPLDPASESWNRLPWRKLEQHFYRIQKRIFQAEQRDNKHTSSPQTPKIVDEVQSGTADSGATSDSG